MPDPLKQSISATQAPALFDASPYLTKWMLYRWFKFGEDARGVGDNRMDWGTRMEPLCLAAAAEDLHFDVHPTRAPDGTQPYVRNGLLGCTRDAEIICPDRGPGALETKCAFDGQVWMRDWNGGKTPPRQHELQIQMQMKVGDGTTSFKWGVLAAWYAGEMFYFERKPMPDLWAALDAEAAKFFADVAAGNEPDPFGVPIEAPLLAQVYPTVLGKVLDLSKLEHSDKKSPLAYSTAEAVRMMEWHSGERLGHDRAEKAIKAKLFGLAKDAEQVLLPHGVGYRIKESPRAGFYVKPSVVRKLDAFVPEDTPEGDISVFDGVDLGG